MYDLKKKTTVLFICKHKQVKSIVFAVSIKFCDKLGLAILTFRSPGRDSSARAISYWSKCIILFKFFFKLLDVDNTDKVCSNDKIGSVHQKCEFHDPLAMIKIMYMLMMRIEYKPFCKDVSIQSLLLVWPLRPMGL